MFFWLHWLLQMYCEILGKQHWQTFISFEIQDLIFSFSHSVCTLQLHCSQAQKFMPALYLLLYCQNNPQTWTLQKRYIGVTIAVNYISLFPERILVLSLNMGAVYIQVLSDCRASFLLCPLVSEIKRELRNFANCPV